jgi:hypothetical protein
MRTRILPALIATLALALGVVACGSDDTTTAEGGDPATTTTAAPAIEPARPTDGGQDAELPTFGFVHAVDASVSPNVVIFDDAELLTGDEALAAAREDHGADVEVPNDYYIRNVSRDKVEHELAADVAITIELAGGEEEVLTPQQWEERITRQAQGEAPYYEPYHFNWEDGVIVAVRSQYLP